MNAVEASLAQLYPGTPVIPRMISGLLMARILELADPKLQSDGHLPQSKRQLRTRPQRACQTGQYSRVFDLLGSR